MIFLLRYARSYKQKGLCERVSVDRTLCVHLRETREASGARLARSVSLKSTKKTSHLFTCCKLYFFVILYKRLPHICMSCTSTSKITTVSIIMSVRKR